MCASPVLESVPAGPLHTRDAKIAAGDLFTIVSAFFELVLDGGSIGGYNAQGRWRWMLNNATKAEQWHSNGRRG